MNYQNHDYATDDHSTLPADPAPADPAPADPTPGASNPPQGPVLDLSDQWARLHDLVENGLAPTPGPTPGPTVIELNPPVATLPAVPFPDLPVRP